MTKAGVSDVWNDKFLKRYGTALIKYQWGSNLSKFAISSGSLSLSRTDDDNIMNIYKSLENK
jgi:hypothetical protein